MFNKIFIMNFLFQIKNINPKKKKVIYAVFLYKFCESSNVNNNLIIFLIIKLF